MSKRKRKFPKSGKGKTFRPCHVCLQTVNFVPWMEETARRKRKIWHWANEDGSHHIHFEEQNDQELNHLREIVNES